MRLVDQQPAIGGAIEHRRLPPRRRQRLVIAEHGLPCGARMRRLDQRIGEIAQQAFLVGELVLRCAQADASRGLDAEPAMHVVVAGIFAGAAEIAAGAAAEHRAAAIASRIAGGSRSLVRICVDNSGIKNVRCQERTRRRRRRPGAVPSSGPRPPSASRSIRTTGRIRMVAMPSRWAAPLLSPAAAKPHPPGIQ